MTGTTTTIQVTLTDGELATPSNPAGLFDADGMLVTLSDVAGLRSVVRLDTGANVLAAPTVPVAGQPATAPAMTRVSLGVYQATVPDPAYGLTYGINYCYYRGNVPRWKYGTKAGTVMPAGIQAVGLFGTDQSIADWLRPANWNILVDSAGDAAAGLRRVQTAIYQADGFITARLGVERSASAPFFNQPLSVNGQPPRLTPSSTAMANLQPAWLMAVAHYLNESRYLTGLVAKSAEENAMAMIPKMDVRSASWLKMANEITDKVGRWIWGYSDGLAIDLDRAADAVVGAPAQRVTVSVPPRP